MKPLVKIRSLLILFLFLAGCISASANTQPTSTQQVDISTSTVTPKPTLTPRPTRTYTPLPTATFTLWSTKEVLAQFGIFGGDGGWDYYAFIGGDMPKWVLYTDGQLIIQKEDQNGIWFEETTLTVPQICSFLSQIENAGFFTLPYDNSSALEAGIPTANPIYQFDNSTQFFEGGSDYVLQVNGPNPRQIHVYHSYVPYLIPEARRVFNLFNNYSSPSKLTSYQAKHMILRIEEGLGDSMYSTPAPITQRWPAELPSLEILAEKNVETGASAFFEPNSTHEIFQVLVQDEQVKQISEAFNNRLAYQLFQSEGRIYYVAARPFLPHENLSDFSEFPEERQFALPFNCSN